MKEKWVFIHILLVRSFVLTKHEKGRETKVDSETVEEETDFHKTETILVSLEYIRESYEGLDELVEYHSIL